MLSPRVFAILAVYFGLTTAGPLSLRQECGGEWECAPIVDTVPMCARPCIADGAKQVGCAADDFICRCQKREEISGLVTDCVLSSCEISDAIKTIESTESLCGCVEKVGGPQPTCPPAASSSVVPPPASSSAVPPASSAAPPASSAAPPASSAASSAAPPASSSPAPPASSASAPPSYSAGPVPSASSSAAPVPSCSAAPAPAPAPAGPWECQPLADAVHDCAIPCIAEGAASVGCDSTDYTCRCNNAAAISEAATACVISACGIATALEVRQQTTDLCTCVAANPPPSGAETPVPTPVEGCPTNEEPSKPEPEPTKSSYPTTPKPEPTKSSYPTTPEPSTPVKEEPPVVTAGAAKILGSGAAALLALAVAL